MPRLPQECHPPLPVERSASDSTLEAWRVYPLIALLSLVLLAGCAESAPAWQELPDAPQARTEVVGAALQGRVVVAGGLTADGAASARVDLYDPKRERWLRLPDLPEAVHHAVAATRRDRLYVAGGYRRASTSDEISRRGLGALRPPLARAASAARGARLRGRGDRAQPALRGRRRRALRAGALLALPRPAHAPLERLPRACPCRGSTWASPRCTAGSTPWAGAPPAWTPTRATRTCTTRWPGTGRGCPTRPRAAAATRPRRPPARS